MPDNLAEKRVSKMTMPIATNDQIKYRRVLLKLSGEALMGSRDYGLDPVIVDRVAKEIKDVIAMGVQVCLVIGGGNIFRGVSGAAGGMDRATADYMGMLATVMNAAALQETLEKFGQPTRVLSAIEVSAICEPFVRRRAIRHLEKGRVTILAGGTGNPFFSTDTCAALRASEIGAELMIKATKVDGVYTDDPVKNPDAALIEHISFQDVLSKNLKVMDPAAVSLCRENHIPIVVLNIFKDGNITRVLQGEHIGTLISDR